MLQMNTTNETGGTLSTWSCLGSIWRRRSAVGHPRVRSTSHGRKPWKMLTAATTGRCRAEPMRRATRAKLKRARRLPRRTSWRTRVLVLRRLGIVALHRGLFAEAPGAGAGARPGAITSTGPGAARGRGSQEAHARRHGRGRQPERGARAEHAIRRAWDEPPRVVDTQCDDDPRPPCVYGQPPGSAAPDAPMTTAPAQLKRIARDVPTRPVCDLHPTAR